MSGIRPRNIVIDKKNLKVSDLSGGIFNLRFNKSDLQVVMRVEVNQIEGVQVKVEDVWYKYTEFNEKFIDVTDLIKNL